MQIPQKYFHDRVVLALLSAASFLAALGIVMILLRLDSSNTTGYIVQFRSNLGLDSFNKIGGTGELLAFGAFNIIVLVVNTMISMKLYHVRRQLSVTVLGMTVLLIILSIIVSNALLLLR